MTSWCSLYLPCADNAQIVAALQESLTALGYTLFNPFGLIPTRAYSQAVRLFVAPVAGNAPAAGDSPATGDSPAPGDWTRVVGMPDPLLLPALSLLAPCLIIELDGADAHISAYAEGELSTPEIAFAAYTHEHDCIHLALETTGAAQSNSSLGGVALDALPADVQALAQRVDLRQAGNMFARMSGTLAAKGGSDPAAAALLRQPDWSGAGGAQISALMNCLCIPAWRTPDFVTLRDAYALHERRRRSPKARLYPGDAETLAAVPDALAYTPVYAGKP